MPVTALPLLVVIVALAMAFIWIFFWAVPVPLWISALAARVHIRLFTLVGMRLRRVPPQLIITQLIAASKAGLDVNTDALEAHFLAGGNVQAVVSALIAADKASIDLTFERAAAIDLAGRNIIDAVKMSVLPRVINTPMIAAVSMDGIQVKATARVTVRTNIQRLVGGATEETIIARVGEGIVSTIGSSTSYKEVLENPDKISKMVLSKGLDSGTAFEILSIDIADVDVGDNIGAQLQMAQADADKNIAQARAEVRRAMALAQEQEMKARVMEMRAKVTEAEAEIPLAMSAAFREGNLGIMDYYRMMNIRSDTEMRGSISRGAGGPADSQPENKE
jgi:uncharacterized protein YqfA (UPF0365 family)